MIKIFLSLLILQEIQQKIRKLSEIVIAIEMVLAILFLIFASLKQKHTYYEFI